MTAAVPTVIALLLQHCEQKKMSLRDKLKVICIGGAACPPVMLNTLIDQHGVDVRHLWGEAVLLLRHLLSFVYAYLAD